MLQTGCVAVFVAKAARTFAYGFLGMDVPTRQAYVMAVVEDHEREAAASLTNLTRTLAQAVTPAMTGWIMQAVALSAPFVLGAR
jgi:hypothetical protein